MAETTKEKSGTKNLVIYYSREGNTKEIAYKIAAFIAGDLVEISEKTQSSSGSQLGFMKLFYRAKAKIPTEVETNTDVIDFDEYETVYFGAPVHVSASSLFIKKTKKNNVFTFKANHLPSPARTWLEENKESLLHCGNKCFHFFTSKSQNSFFFFAYIGNKSFLKATWGTGARALFEDTTEILGKEPVATLVVTSKDVKKWRPSMGDFFVLFLQARVDA